jgi:hypothetical protein
VSVNEGVVEVPGARLAYIDTGGRGVPVVLLHAGTAALASGSINCRRSRRPAFA